MQTPCPYIRSHAAFAAAAAAMAVDAIVNSSQYGNLAMAKCSLLAVKVMDV
jgi:hypothetical protein